MEVKYIWPNGVIETFHAEDFALVNDDNLIVIGHDGHNNELTAIKIIEGSNDTFYCCGLPQLEHDDYVTMMAGLVGEIVDIPEWNMVLNKIERLPGRVMYFITDVDNPLKLAKPGPQGHYFIHAQGKKYNKVKLNKPVWEQ